ncbi:MAG: TetR/AcrR family transcriptional regulator [Gammaproteobacteria bacterium]|nr:TetR/AcrR family transcriptional regulator [Gammaproteobacteria bacterium]
MPWQKNYDQIKVLEKAMQAFWAHGYEATSINDLVKATGINRGSIYAAFPNKHELFMRALEYYDQVYRRDHLQQIADQYAPLDAIIAVFESAASKPDGNRPWGCLLVNTALELSPHDPEIGEFVSRSLQAVEEFFFYRIEAAKQQQSIASNLDSDVTAKALLGLFLGLRVLTRAKPRKATIDAVISQARMMLE